MPWIAPSEKDTASTTLEKRLWDTAFQRGKLQRPSPSGPPREGLGVKAPPPSRRGSRVVEPAAYHAEGILYLAPEARFDHLLTLPEAANIGAMREIEKHNPQLAGMLPKTYNLFTSTLLKELLKKVSEIPASLDFDAFGRIYEYLA
jgi:type I restriction enzyme M protein